MTTTHNTKGFFYALVLLCIISALAFFISSTLTPFLSPLIIGILLGAALSPLYPRLNTKLSLQNGINFSAKKLLRLGIILYGSFITLSELATLGLNGVAVALIVVGAVFCLAIMLGRLLKLDSEIAMLVGIGSAVCGAAAILALESTLKSSPAKSSVALGFIVIFGLLGMVLLPLVYYSGVLPLSDYQWGVFIGGSLHEVANVVGAGAVSADAASVALLVKMARVVLLVPLLFLISFVLYKQESLDSTQGQNLAQNTPQNAAKNEKKSLYIPYFALWFLVVIVLNSLIDFPPIVVESAQFSSKVLLVFAMAALGLQIDWKQFVSFGLKTFILALALFIILLGGTYALVRVLF